ncbi:methylmalonyl Co-A mutase-associated GTPase MeaB [Rubrolithibacter danxiaensis]|uniref:methylmalonyl Co-A mutase-associated GTPase MeaB n=1 Tax=Rubrolithibacter danxiaensis TaxID=3390805 RepID=UPI003BF7E20E
MKYVKPEFRKIARTLTIIENDLEGCDDILHNLPSISGSVVLGITGPPGAGKSTLISKLISKILKSDKRIAVLAVDPTSPFNYGSLLGDRIRMNEHFNNQNVFIRSVATRGSLGGISAKTIEMVDVLKAAGFDYVIVETVGVGQSEVEIAGLADVTVLVLVPEAGDEIQHIKAGLMEIADVFAVNKADRPGAAEFANNLKKLTTQRGCETPVIKTNSEKAEGIDELLSSIHSAQKTHTGKRKEMLLAEKAWSLIQSKKMKGIDKKKLQQEIAEALKESDFNLYRFVNDWIRNS